MTVEQLKAIVEGSLNCFRTDCYAGILDQKHK